MKKVDFYFDFISPFSYFAWKNTAALRKEVHFVLKPVALGTILNHWQIKGPGEVWPKRIYLLKNCLRYADKHHIPFATPKLHPFNSLYALRMCLKSVAQEHQESLIEACWNYAWVERNDLSQPEALVEYLEQQGFNGQRLYDLSFERSAKQELKSNIQQAIDAGVFGVPSFVCEDELFWGNDSLDDLRKWLNGDRGYNPDLLNTLIQETSRGAEQSIL